MAQGWRKRTCLAAPWKRARRPDGPLGHLSQQSRDLYRLAADDELSRVESTSCCTERISPWMISTVSFLLSTHQPRNTISTACGALLWAHSRREVADGAMALRAALYYHPQSEAFSCVPSGRAARSTSRARMALVDAETAGYCAAPRDRDRVPRRDPGEPVMEELTPKNLGSTSVIRRKIGKEGARWHG